MKEKERKKEYGQSLVEVALFLPILVILIAGVIEASQLVITQNRISNAARIASRFAANGGEDDGMWVVAMNAVTQTLPLTEDLWDMWSIRATTNSTGDDFSAFNVSHIYGISNTTAFGSVDWAAIQQEMLDEVRRDESGNLLPAEFTSNVQLVGTLILHDVETILGIEALPGMAGINTIQGMSMMRMVGLGAIEQTDGCSGFPIAVSSGTRSTTSTEYPPADTFDYPDNPPSFEDFPNNVPGVPLDQAEEGYLYLILNGFGEGNFGWLSWNDGINPSSVTLADSLSWPGNGTDYQDHGDGGQPASPQNWPWVVRGFVEAGDSDDISMHVGDWVAASTGSINSNGVRTQLEEHMDLNRDLRLLIWDEYDGTGGNGRYRISGFAIFRLIGYKLDQGQGSDSWILAEFVRWDTSCGQVVAAP